MPLSLSNVRVNMPYQVNPREAALAHVRQARILTPCFEERCDSRCDPVARLGEVRFPSDT